MQQDTSLLFTRVEILERTVQFLQKQFDQYFLMKDNIKENETQLRLIKETIEQIKKEILEIKQDIKDVDVQIAKQTAISQEMHTEFKTSQDKLVIQVLAYVVGTIVTVGGLIVVGIVTHFIH